MSIPVILRREAAALRDIIRRVIKELDERHKKKYISTDVGKYACLRGGLPVVRSFLAIPTAGLTLPLAGAGALVAGAGSVVCLGASKIEFIIEKYDLSDVEKRWEKLLKDLVGHYTTLSGSEDLPRIVFDIVGKIISGTTEMAIGFDLIRTSMASAHLFRAGERGARAIATASKVARVRDVDAVIRMTSLGSETMAIGVLNAVFIPLSLVDLVRSATAAAGDEPSEASAKLKRMADFLDRVANDELPSVV